MLYKNSPKGKYQLTAYLDYNLVW